jgi:hypothetical protein
MRGQPVSTIRARARPLSCALVPCTLASCVLTSCATIVPDVPREIVYDAARGNWTLISDLAPTQIEASEPHPGEQDSHEPGPDESAPIASRHVVPIITLIDNRRVEGLILAPGSPGYERTVRVHEHTGQTGGAELLLPYVVKHEDSGWRVMGVRFSVTRNELLALHAQASPAQVPIAADGESIFRDIGIGRRQGYCGTRLSRRQARRMFGPCTLWPTEDRQR